MATLIPAIGTCVSRMTSGERRLAQRLEQKLESDYLLWYDVPLGPANSHPDFVILHPRRGILILEVKDWRLDNLRKVSRHDVELLTERGLSRVINPLEQARQYAHAVTNVLERDAQLTFSSGKLVGRLRFPWSYGVVLANISRRQFEESGIDQAIDAHRVICQDEMLESAEAEDFQRQLWQMFALRFEGALSLPQIDRVRWHLYPEIRIPAVQSQLFGADCEADGEMPDLLRVMDIQQEQLARSLGEGHRVIHGVAGSGKTLILTYRAQHLAQMCTKPVLILCYNRTLAGRLKQVIEARHMADRVRVHTFHSWCRAQMQAYHVQLPAEGADASGWFEELVDGAIRACERGQIPAAQYEAILIDEGHDFRPEWLKLIVQMVDPKTNSLLLLYDDAQSIYERERKRKFSFKSVGVQARGRSTILKVNYRNTREVLELATRFAADLLKAKSADEDNVPLVSPVSAGRNGPEPLVISLPTIGDEARYIAERLKEAHRLGTPWRDMAVIYRDYAAAGKPLISTLRGAGIPLTYFKDARFSKDQDTVKALTMHSCKGLEFPMVAIAGVGRGEAQVKQDAEEMRLLYVAMTRATNQLIVCGAGSEALWSDGGVFDREFFARAEEPRPLPR